MAKTGYIENGVFHETESGLLVPSSSSRVPKPNAPRRMSPQELEQLMDDAQELGLLQAAEDADLTLADLERLVEEKKTPPPPPSLIPRHLFPRKPMGEKIAGRSSPKPPPPPAIRTLDDAMAEAKRTFEASPELQHEFRHCPRPLEAYKAYVEAVWNGSTTISNFTPPQHVSPATLKAPCLEDAVAAAEQQWRADPALRKEFAACGERAKESFLALAKAEWRRGQRGQAA